MHIANKFCAALVGVQVKKYHIASFTDYCMCMWESVPGYVFGPAVT